MVASRQRSRRDELSESIIRRINRLRELEDALEDIGRLALHNRSPIWGIVKSAIGEHGEKRETQRKPAPAS